MHASTAFADAPVATLYYRLNGGAWVWVDLPGEALRDGSAQYLYSAGDESWEVTCDLTADHTANPKASLAGIVNVKNTSIDTLSFEWRIDVPICPSIQHGSLVGGVSVLTFTTNDGGWVGCLDGIPIVRSIANLHQTVGELFSCPTYFYMTGSGTITYTLNFGTPMPSAIGPELIHTIGEHQQFSVSAGDSVKVQFVFIYEDEAPQSEGGCAGDFDGDDLVGPADVTELLTKWGTVDPCIENVPTDMNADGIVDAADLTMLLNSWGSCG